MKHYLGYATLEDFLREIQREEPLNGGYFHMTLDTDSMGVVYRESYVILSQIDERDICHYWRMRLALTQHIHGTPFNTDYEDRKAASEAGWAIVREYLDQEGYLLRQAVVSMPKTYRVLDGSTRLMRYDRQAKRFVAEPNGLRVPS